jgi:hypothetical protein
LPSPGLAVPGFAPPVLPCPGFAPGFAVPGFANNRRHAS